MLDVTLLSPPINFRPNSVHRGHMDLISILPYLTGLGRVLEIGYLYEGREEASHKWGDLGEFFFFFFFDGTITNRRGSGIMGPQANGEGKKGEMKNWRGSMEEWEVRW